MSWLVRLRRYVRDAIRGRHLARDIDAELQFHLDGLVDDMVERGASRDEARRIAHRRFGRLDVVRDDARYAKGVGLIDDLRQDVRYALRGFGRNPAFTAVAFITLTLGIGASTAVFTAVNAVLLRPFPYADSERLVRIYEANPRQGHERFDVSAGNYLDWQRQSHTFEAIGLYAECRRLLTSATEPQYLDGATVSPNLMQVLGVQPALGRSFAPFGPDEFSYEVLISYDLWQRQFGGDAHVLGRTLVFERRPLTIVGVMPRGFHFPARADFWMPTETFPGTMGLLRRSERYRQSIGRLAPGVDLERASAEMRTIARRLDMAYPSVNAGWTVALVPLRETVVGDVRRSLVLLLGAVGCLLLIGCVNVANLILARGAARRHEILVRVALGATRLRLLRQALTESLVLSAAGGLAGTWLGVRLAHLLVRFAPADVPRLGEVTLDWRVLAFSVGASLLAGVAAGMIPAWHAASQPAAPSNDRSMAARRGLSQRVLLAAEVGLAFVLLVEGGLLVRSFVRLRSVDPGFAASHVTRADVTILPGSITNVRPWYELAVLYNGLVDRVAHLPGIQSAGAIDDVPLSTSASGGGPVTSFVSAGAAGVGVAASRWPVTRLVVTPGYFRTMGIALVGGRLFTAADAFTEAGLTSMKNNESGVVVVNHTLARMLWPGQDPLGKRLSVDFDWTASGRLVIGVVADVRSAGLDVASRPEAYLPQDQAPRAYLSLVVRSTLEPQALSVLLRREIRAFRPGLLVHDVQTMDEIVGGSLARPRFAMLIMSAFAVIGLALGAVGLYGVLAYLVTRRTRELGIRMALGADRRTVMAMVMRDGMVVVTLGALGGLGIALATGRLVSHLLFGVTAYDPVTMVAVTALLGAVAAAACYLPARRATRIEPSVALRRE